MNLSKTKNNMQNIRIIDVKKRIYGAVVALLFTSISATAQSTPPNPPPIPDVSVTTSSTSTSSTSINSDSHDSSHSSSISISHSNDSYKFKARYHSSKNNGVKEMLISELGRKNLKIKGNTLTWLQSKNGEEFFECKLSKGRLYIDLDTNNASTSFSEKIKTLGLDLKYYISNSNKEEDQSRKLHEAEKNLEHAKKNLEKAKRDLERSKKN